MYKNRAILHGCGDLLNDYEGINGHETFRADLALMYFVTVNATTGQLTQLEMTPPEIRQFKLNHACDADARWLRDRLNRECTRFGYRIQQSGTNPSTLRLVESSIGRNVSA